MLIFDSVKDEVLETLEYKVIRFDIHIIELINGILNFLTAILWKIERDTGNILDLSLFSSGYVIPIFVYISLPYNKIGA